MRSSCEHLLNLRKRSLVEHELLRIEDVVHIDEVGKGGLDAGQVAGGEDDVLVGLRGHDQSLAVGVDCAQETGELLGLDLVHLDLVDDDDVSGLSLGAQNGLQSQTADLLVERVAVIAGLRGKDDAAVRPLRGAGAALAGVAGALLLPGLLAAAGDLSAGQCGLRALTAVGQMILDDVVDDGLVGLDAVIMNPAT